MTIPAIPTPRNHCVCDDTEDFTLDQRNASKPPAPISTQRAGTEDDRRRDERARNAFLRAWAERQVRLSDYMGGNLEVVAPKGYRHQECCAAIHLVVLERRAHRAWADHQASRQADLTCVPSLRGTALAALAALWREVEAWCGAHPTAKWAIGAGIGAVAGGGVAYGLVRAIAWMVWQ